MDHVRLGTSDLEVARLCFGGNVFGWTADKDTSYAVLDAYDAAGGNFIDTADAYSAWVPGHTGGESESIIGDWMAERGNRLTTIVATKVSKKPDRPGLSRDNIIAACGESLDRLRTDYIDLYYCHADDPETPLEETLTAMAELIADGKVRYIAASNYSTERLAEALRIADALDLPRFVAVQPHYNLMVRDEFEGPMAQLCERETLSCVPYFALAAGFLTGKYRTAEVADTARGPRIAHYLNDRGWQILEAVDTVAERHGVANATIALAWLLHQPTVATPIASASRVDQLPALLAAFNVHLSSDDLAILHEATS